MSLQHLSKYRLDKKAMLEIRGSGEGMVVCEDGTKFSATAESMESVHTGGDRWCEHNGHGKGKWYFFFEDEDQG